MTTAPLPDDDRRRGTARAAPLTSIEGGLDRAPAISIDGLITFGAIAPRVSAPTKRQALAVAAEIAARVWRLRAPAVFEALMEREAAGSTGVGHGVATPHARVEGLNGLAGVFVRLQKPIEFGAVDDQPVDLIFALFAPPDAGSDHLRALARIARLLRRAETRTALRQARTPEEIRSVLVQEARPSAA